MAGSTLVGLLLTLYAVGVPHALLSYARAFFSRVRSDAIEIPIAEVAGVVEVPLQMAVCPLGSDCLADGPLCFATAEANELKRELRRALTRQGYLEQRIQGLGRIRAQLQEREARLVARVAELEASG